MHSSVISTLLSIESTGNYSGGNDNNNPNSLPVILREYFFF